MEEVLRIEVSEAGAKPGGVAPSTEGKRLPSGAPARIPDKLVKDTGNIAKNTAISGAAGAGMAKMMGKGGAIGAAIGVGVGALAFLVGAVKRSKIFSAFMNSLLTIFGAVVDILLIPLIPMLVRVLNAALGFFRSVSTKGLWETLAAGGLDWERILRMIFPVIPPAGVLDWLFEKIGWEDILRAIFPIIPPRGVLDWLFDKVSLEKILMFIFTPIAVVRLLDWLFTKVDLHTMLTFLFPIQVGVLKLLEHLFPFRINANDILDKVFSTAGNIWDWLKGLVGLQAGTPYVPRDMLALLHRGEAVIPASQNVFNFNQSFTTAAPAGYLAGKELASGFESDLSGALLRIGI